MSQENTPSIVSGKKPRRPVWRTLVRISLALVLLSLTPFLVFLLILWNQERQGQKALEQRLAERAANQKPIDEASLQARYRSQCSGTMASEWTTILQEIVALDLDQNREMAIWMNLRKGGLPTSEVPWINEAEIRKLAEKWKPLIDQVLMAAAEDRQVEMPKFVPGYHQQLSLQRSRDIARLLALHCDLAMIDRNSKEITESILAGLGTARAFEGSPSMALSLTSVAVEGMQLDSLKTALERDLLDKSDLQRIAQRLPQRTPFSRLADNSIQNQVATMIDITGKMPNRLWIAFSTNLTGFLSSFRRSRDAIDYLDSVHQLEQLPTDDWWVWLRSDRSFVRENRSKNKDENRLEEANSLYWGALPAIEAELKAIVRREMLYQLAEHAISVRLFEGDYGHLPLERQDLSLYLAGEPVSKSALDQTLGFRATPGSIVLWTFDPSSSFMDKLPIDPDAPEFRQSYGDYLRWELKDHSTGVP